MTDVRDVIRIENLCKSYGQVKAVQNLSFKVKQGELFAFLGINGAGKSTTISLMSGTLKKDDGKIYINGEDIDEKMDLIKSSIGIVFQSSVLDKTLTARENLLHRASLYNIIGKDFDDRLSELNSLFNFEEILDRPLNKLSGGQKRKIDIVRALIHNPKILILDEPTTGLDPQTRTNIWEVIEGMRKKNNLTVLLTTHYMEEASEADYVVIIDGGICVAEGTPHQLKNQYSSDSIMLYGDVEEQVKQLGIAYEKRAGGVKIEVESTKIATELIVKYPDLFVDYEITKGKMDSVFLTVTGKNLYDVTKDKMDSTFLAVSGKKFSEEK